MLKNILTDEMPFAVKVNGTQFILRTDFRLWIQAGEIFRKIGKTEEFIQKYAKEENLKRLQDKLEEKNKLFVDLCDLVIEEYPTDGITTGEDLLFGLLEFYKGYPKPPMTEAQKKNAKSKQENEKRDSFDFAYDANYIYCSFASFYGLRLQNVEYMHWWEFLELFNGLLMSDQTSVNFVVGTRQQKIRADLPKSEKTRLQKLKKQFELPKDEETVQAEDGFVNIS